MGTWGSEKSRGEHARMIALMMQPGGAWVCTGQEAVLAAPVAVLGARARRGVEEALILAEFSQRERARLERVRAAVIGGYWTDALREGEEPA